MLLAGPMKRQLLPEARAGGGAAFALLVLLLATVAARSISASAAADIGGDLDEALDTPYGVRMIIGDVRGKGLDAVRLASIVLGSYRHVAFERADLRAIVADLDRAVARSVGDEDFVTAALIEERGGTLPIGTC